MSDLIQMLSDKNFLVFTMPDRQVVCGLISWHVPCFGCVSDIPDVRKVTLWITIVTKSTEEHGGTASPTPMALEVDLCMLHCADAIACPWLSQEIATEMFNWHCTQF